jgi:hypothetical protein
MATAATIKKNIAKLEAALKSKATPKSLKSKLETQLVKSKAELSGINKGAKPKTSTSKSAQTSLQKLKEMVNKNKKLKTYKKSGVDLEKDADRPALPIGRRTAKQSGKTYYEYRANRIDVKQPPKKYPKLEKGGYMAHGGEMKHSKIDEMIEKYQTWLDKNNLPKMSADELLVDESVNLTKEQRKYIQNFINEWEEEQDKYAKGGYMADGGKIAVRNEGVDEISEMGGKRYGVEIQDEESGDVLDYEYFDSEEEAEDFVNKYKRGGYFAKGGETAKFQVDDVVYHKKHNTIGIVRIEESRGEVKTDADGNVDVDELEYYNPLKHESHKNAKIAPSTLKEIEKRRLWNPFSERTSQLAKGGYYAKGGAMEHGLKRGDTIIDDMFFDKSVKVLNNKTGYAVVHLETGERKEMKAMGGEMHRTQE